MDAKKTDMKQDIPRQMRPWWGSQEGKGSPGSVTHSSSGGTKEERKKREGR